MANKEFLDLPGLQLYNSLLEEKIDDISGIAYESKPAAENGQDLTLVTTGEKYQWNEKSVVEYTPEVEEGTKIGTISINNDATDLYAPSPTTESDIAGMGFTKNVGTVTGITMNGETVGTSGNIDLGTVITEHQDISGKVDKNGTDSLMTQEEHTKLAGIASGAEANVQSDWSQTTDTADDYIKNKPTLGTASALDVPASGNATTSQVVKGNDTRLSDARTPKAHTHITSEITDFPELATVATSGKYSDLSGTPTIPAAVAVKGDAESSYRTGNVNITKANIGLGNVENKSSATIRGELTSTNVTTALGYTPMNNNLKGANNGVAELDSNGKVPSSQLPSYVDDVLEYTAKANFPTTGETGKIYVDTTTNLQYRWSGTAYVEISPSIALGETSSTAYRGDRGKVAYDHASAKGSAFSSGLYKITTNAEGHVTAATAVAKSDITALGIPASNTNTTYTLTQDSSDGHKFTFAGSDGTSVTITIPDNNTTYTLSSLGIGNVKNYDQSKAIKSITRSGTTFTYTCLDNTTGTFTQQDNNTWTAMVGATSSANGTAGYVPAPPKDGYNTKYLRADGTWTIPSYPTVNNATLTIQKNGTNVQTFTANQGTNATANITVPTKVSELTNDSGYTTNTGTITGINMNGASKGTSGVVDLGTVLTSHQDISGKVNKSGDTMTGNLIIKRTSTYDNNTPATLQLSTVDSTNSVTSNGTISAYQAGVNGATFVINPAGNMFLGSGEAATNHYNASYKHSEGEVLYLTSDNQVHIQSNGQTIANRVGIQIDNSGNVIPEKADVATNNIGSIGTSSYKFANGYFTNINGVAVGTPAFTDTKVTSVGNHYTPAEDTSAVLSADASSTTAATWNSTSLVTGVDIKRDAKGHVVGVAVDSIKMPANPNTNTDTLVTQTATSTSANYEVLFSATADNTTRTETARKNSNLLFNPNTGNLQATQLNGVTIGSSPKFTDTTYSSKTAASGGTDVSLVTTGEKYTWNSKTSNTGTVTSIATGTGLTGGTITTSGTISTYLARVAKDSKVFPGANKIIWEEYTAGDSYNLPTNAWYHIISMQGSDTKYGTQLALGMTSNAAYYRNYNNSTWSSWYSLINSNWTSHLYAGSGAAANATTTNGNTKLALCDNSTVRNTITIKGTGATTVTSDANGVITINSTDNNTNTLNTAGSTDTSSKIFLIGATSQAANPQTYSHDTAYVGTDGCLYSGGTKVLTAHQDISGKADKSATVSTVAWDSTNNKLTKTINGTTSDVVTAATILGNLTKTQVTTALGYTPPTSDTNNRKAFYGTCATAAATKDKVVTLAESAGWPGLVAGVIVGVKFTYTNTYSSATANPITLNVNSTGAKNIWYNTTHSGAGNTGTNTTAYGIANQIMYYMYDGTYWVWLGHSADNNTDVRPSAYCDTAAGTAAKVASCSGYNLLANSYIHVVIVNTNTSAGAITLNINGKGAKPIYINGAASSSSNYALTAGSYLVFYNGTNYYFRTDGKITAAGLVNTSNSSLIPTVNNATLTIQKNGTTVQTFTANQSSNATANITVPTKTSELTNDSGFLTAHDGNNAVTQTATTTSANYEVLFSVTADNTTRTEGARKNSNLLFNPSTGNLQATQLNGVTIGSSPKFTDTNTWRGVQNNLTSTATDQSLSAAQGKILNEKITNWTATQTLAAGATSVTFTGLTSTYAYDLYSETADGTPVYVTNSVVSGTQITYTLTAITSAQAGSAGTGCKVKLKCLY